MDPAQMAPLYQSEAGSDVALVVGAGGARERVPAHSRVLAQNAFFRKALSSHPRELVLEETDLRSFRSLLKHLYHLPCPPSSPPAALALLYLATRYEEPSLIRQTLAYLTQHLTPDNVLLVLAWAHHYSSVVSQNPSTATSQHSPSSPSSPHSPSAPPHDEQPPPYPGPLDPPPPYAPLPSTEVVSECSRLVQTCLDLVDRRAAAVLASEAAEEVECVLLCSVLSRDTLILPSEMVVVEAVLRWSTAECRRRHLPLTLPQRRAVLGEMLTLPRLLTLPRSSLPSTYPPSPTRHVAPSSPSPIAHPPPYKQSLCSPKFPSLPTLEQLYTPEEISYVVSRIHASPHNKADPVPAIFAHRLPQMSERRRSSIERIPPSPTSGGSSPLPTKPKNKGKEILWDIFTGVVRIFD